MSLFHLNTAMAGASRCETKGIDCVFGSEDSHYTSLEAAQKIYNLAHLKPEAGWSPNHCKLDIGFLHILAQSVFQPKGDYSLSSDEEPVGGLVSKSGDHTGVLVKAEDEKWHELVDVNSNDENQLEPKITIASLSHKTIAMEAYGTTKYSFLHMPESTKKRIQQRVASELEKLSSVLARGLYIKRSTSLNGNTQQKAIENYAKLSKSDVQTKVNEAHVLLEIMAQARLLGGELDYHIPELVFRLKETHDDFGLSTLSYYEHDAEGRAEVYRTIRITFEVLLGSN